MLLRRNKMYYFLMQNGDCNVCAAAAPSIIRIQLNQPVSTCAQAHAPSFARAQDSKL